MLKKLWKAVGALISNPKLIGVVRHDNRLWRAKFERKYGHGNSLPVVDLDHFVPDHAVLESYTFLGSGSMITDLLLLKYLALRDSVQSYFELGLWRGESMLAVRPHVGLAYSFDLPPDAMKKHGYSDRMVTQVGTLTSGTPDITYIQGDSNSFDFATVGRTFDLLFIDGNHTYEYVRHDTSAIFRHLIHDNSIVVWHDYGFQPEHVRWEVYMAILDTVPKELHGCIYHVQNTKCAIFMRQPELRARLQQFPQDVSDLWEVTIRRRPR